MECAITHHQYLGARSQKEFSNADEEALAHTLERLSKLPKMFAGGSDLFMWDSDNLALDSNK
jgi:hypothetical protein